MLFHKSWFLVSKFYQVEEVVDLHPRADLLGNDQQPDLGLHVLPDPGESGGKFPLNVLSLQMLVKVGVGRAVSALHLVPVHDLEEESLG